MTWISIEWLIEGLYHYYYFLIVFYDTKVQCIINYNILWWVLISSTSKVSDGYIKDLEFNSCLL